MSVTFTFASYRELSDGVYLVHGVDCTHKCHTPDTCEDWGIYGICDHSELDRQICGCRDYDLNVSNTNAHDLLGRAMVANVGRDDSGVATTEVTGGMGARLIDCGLRPGYYDDRLAALVELATEAKKRGVLVGWG